MKFQDLLKDLDLGSSVAEFDEALERYFVETPAFRALTLDKADVIAGEKGTGKSALYRVFSRRYTTIPQLKEVEVIPGFNMAGNPVFQRLAQMNTLSEGQYITVWKSYFLSLIGNWLLALYDGDHTKRMRDLDSLLVRVGLRSTDDSAETIFSKLINVFNRVLNPKSAEVSFTLSEAGIPVVAPKLEFEAPAPSAERADLVSHEHALKQLNDTLEDVKLTAWVALDRLDEAFQGFPAVEIPVLRALLRTYLDYLPTPVSASSFSCETIFQKSDTRRVR